MFHLLDLPSQAAAVQALLRGKSNNEKVEWLAQRGTIATLGEFDGRQTYYFESTLGLSCAFLIIEDEFVFVGDNTFFRVPAKPH